MFTEKFQKELCKFINWADEKYIIFDKENNKISWSKIDDINYEEPPRNKLDMYIKELMKNYKIKTFQEENTIENYKTIIINFKNDKHEKKMDKNKKKQQKLNKENNTIISISDFDSSDFYWHDTLDNISSEQLINVLGDPEYTYNESSFHIWEWKITIKKNKYSIYDWKSQNLYDIDKHTKDNLKNIIWHISGENKKKSINDIKTLLKYINTNSKIIKPIYEKKIHSIEDIEENEQDKINSNSIEEYDCIDQDYEENQEENYVSDEGETNEIIEMTNNINKKTLNKLDLQKISFDDIQF